MRETLSSGEGVRITKVQTTCASAQSELRFCYSFIEKVSYLDLFLFEPRHEISNNVVCATSKASD